jgi:hypothetical protein
MPAETQHTPEPWELTRHATPDYAPQCGIYSEDHPADFAIVKGEANARRIVACVNACKGINPEAVPDLLEALQDVLHEAEEKDRSERLTAERMRSIADWCRSAIRKATETK